MDNIPHETAETGCVRSVLFEHDKFGFPIRLDLILANGVAMRRLGATLGEGSTKYGDLNWQKGFKESVYLCHAMEHLRRYMAGDRSEDHLAHAVWNLNTLMWVEENKPELLDLTSQLSDSIGLLYGNTEKSTAQADEPETQP